MAESLILLPTQGQHGQENWKISVPLSYTTSPLKIISLCQLSNNTTQAVLLESEITLNLIWIPSQATCHTKSSYPPELLFIFLTCPTVPNTSSRIWSARLFKTPEKESMPGHVLGFQDKRSKYWDPSSIPFPM